MIVYWKVQKNPKVKISEDGFGNPFYEQEEKFGEVIGAINGGNGSYNQRLIVAKPDGKISKINIDGCYHKSTILVDDVAWEQPARVYGSRGMVTNKDDVYTIEQWKDSVDDGMLTDDDGTGYWVKDGYSSSDEVFSTDQLDATHVVWFNK